MQSLANKTSYSRRNGNSLCEKNMKTYKKGLHFLRPCVIIQVQSTCSRSHEEPGTERKDEHI